jgi:hypothetical protein
MAGNGRVARKIRELALTIHRWARSPLQRRYELGFYTGFWQVRNRWHQSRFWLSKQLYGVRRGAEARAESTSILVSLGRTVVGQLVAAGLLVALLAFLDRNLPIVTLLAGWAARHWQYGQRLVGFLPQKALDPSISAATLSTLAQISGLFLGLYFTAISVVAGQNYAKVSTEILDALVREKVGNLYIRVVAFFGATSLILLGCSTFGYETGYSNIVLVTTLGIASVFSFVELGRRAFYFFDAAKLVRFLANEILQAARAVTDARFLWLDGAFQDHYRKQADNDIRIYEDVILLSDQENRLEGRSLLTLALQFLVLLEVYSEHKKRIPTKSLWFERVYRHRAWLTTEETRVNLAVGTGTGLEPEYVPEHLWFERRMGSLLTRVLKALTRRADIVRAITVCNKLQDTLGVLGKELAVTEALELLQRLKTFAHEVATETKLGADISTDNAEPLAAAVGVADVCGMGFIAILLGFGSGLEELSARRFEELVNEVDFRRPRTLYRRGLPRKVVEQFEYLAKGIEVEYQVEGHQVSPEWYCRQIAALGMTRFFVEACEGLLMELEKTYAVEAESLSAAKKYAFAAQVVQRGLEACHKFHFRIEQFDRWFTDYATLRRVSDIPWPEFDPKKAHEQIEVVRGRLLSVVATSAQGIAALPVSDKIPDYLGQTYVMLAEECYRSMTTGGEASFAKFFSSFFAVSIVVQDRLRAQMKDRDVKTAVVYMTEPVEDLLAISGYALVYSELDKKNFWLAAKNCWEQYFSKVPDSGAVVKFLISTISYRRSLFAILPRDLRRTAWTQDLMHRLRERGLSRDLFGSGSYGLREKGPQHPSALIRVLARQSILGENPADIFLASYLLSRPEAAGVEVARAVRDFRDRMEREKRKSEAEDDEDEA